MMIKETNVRLMALLAMLGLLVDSSSMSTNANQTVAIQNGSNNMTQFVWPKWIRNYKQPELMLDPKFLGKTSDSIPFIVHNISGPIPDRFDAREAWPNCLSTISHVRSEGSCKADWAMSVAGAISDRICIKSKNRVNVLISDIDLACCTECQSKDGFCYGGSTYLAWNYFHKSGLVTGGDADLDTGCKPFRPIDAKVCQRSCTNEKYKRSYQQDLYKGSSSYRVLNHVKQIQMEIMTNGPVTAEMRTPWNFVHYTSGIFFKHWIVFYNGQNAVRLIGWGVEDGQQYWLGVNSWGSNWGTNGVFKIVRGANECYIEDKVYAGKINIK